MLKVERVLEKGCVTSAHVHICKWLNTDSDLNIKVFQGLNLHSIILQLNISIEP